MDSVLLAVDRVKQKSWCSLARQLLLKPLIMQRKIPLALLFQYVLKSIKCLVLLLWFLMDMVVNWLHLISDTHPSAFFSNIIYNYPRRTTQMLFPANCNPI